MRAGYKNVKKKFTQYLYNLLRNSIKYRSPDRTPIVSIQIQQENDFLRVVVQDNGLGMSEHNQKPVFDMFKRFHNHIEGSGIAYIS
ncbi:MAG: hypothetical protein H7259_07655 [Cytophagales bacterium]|nr:hypothetical protein [Cytophaga sp.]